MIKGNESDVANFEFEAKQILTMIFIVRKIKELAYLWNHIYVIVMAFGSICSISSEHVAYTSLDLVTFIL